MRVTATGSVRLLDVEVFGALARAFHDEWRQLRFDSDGLVVDPETGAARAGLQLAGGRHGTSRARYLATFPVTALAVADPLSAWDETEGPDRAWSMRADFHARRDSADRVVFSGSEADSGVWRGEATVEHGGPLRITAQGRSDILGLCAALGSPLTGLAALLLRGKAAFGGVVDLAPMQQRRAGRLAHIDGRVGRYRFDISVDHTPGPDRTDIAVVVTLAGRGSARLVLLCLGPFIRRAVADMLTDALGDVSMRKVADDVARVHAAAATRCGGPAGLAHALLWKTSPRI